jgi:hypothetical protein
MIELELQKAIFTKLSADLTVPIYSMGAVPDNARGLYVTIGADTHLEFDTDDELGFESTITIHAWDNNSASRGFGEVKALQSDIYLSLHRAELNVINYNFISCSYEFSDTLIDADGLTKHGIMRFRILTNGA